MKSLLTIIITALVSIFTYQAYLMSNTQDSSLGKPMEATQNNSPIVKSILNFNNQDLSSIAEKSVDSIVNIASTKIVKYRMSPFFDDPFFEHFFGQGQNPFGVPREQRQQSLGSGVIVSQDGHILTNNHVINDASEVKVKLTDQSEHKAKIIGVDPHTDLALIQIKLPQSFKALQLGDSDQLRLAETVLAIGSPFGLGGTVTMGIVSAKGRANVGIVDYEDFIQTDAAINPGNSGGALINLKGELIGINTAIYSKSGGYQGIGFAIPINMAKHVMDQLIQYGKIERGWLGLHYQDITAEIAKALQLKKTSGVLVRGIYQNSPADTAGFKPGDVLLEYNKTKLKNSGHLSKLLSETPIASVVTFKVIRDNKKIQIKSTLAKLPKQLRKNRPYGSRR